MLWYPVRGNNKIRQAPDGMVVFGRPKGRRVSYKQWEEENIPPQVVFEVLSPGNRAGKMADKLLFYQRYGVEEYYIYDPDGIEIAGLIRSGDWLERIENMNSWVSPRLGIRFELTENTLEIYRPDGQRFLTFVELDQLREQERLAKEIAIAEAEQERQRAEQERQRADEAIARLQQEQQRYQDILEQLRQRGIDLEQL